MLVAIKTQNSMHLMVVLGFVGFFAGIIFTIPHCHFRPVPKMDYRQLQINSRPDP